MVKDKLRPESTLIHQKEVAERITAMCYNMISRQMGSGSHSDSRADEPGVSDSKFLAKYIYINLNLILGG